MYIYNVTTNVEEQAVEKWLQWMNTTHIPDMIATGKFTAAKMTRVVIEEEMGGTTFSVQYTTESKAILERYYKEDAERLQQEAMALFADKCVSFRTELEVLSEH